jgi:Tol biopolymer transport system component
MTSPTQRRGVQLLAFLLLVAAVAVPLRADAARWDPALRWHTLFTEHFAIHFHQGETHLAVELAQTAEEIHALLVPWMKWEPFGRTQVVLVDPTDTANGYATTVPNNAIVLYAVQPSVDSSLDNYEHWLWAIFVHEYTHILQIDMVGGLPRVARNVVGRLILPGGVLPRWMTEGFAVYTETRFTAGGRGRSTYADMLMRTSALEGSWPQIDIAEGYGSAWPRGNLRYLYGGRFHFEVERRAPGGDAAWIDFHQRHSRYVIPYLLPAKQAFGMTLSRMWKEWKADMAAFYLNEADRIAGEGRGLTPTRVLATRKGMAWRPRYSPDGESVLYVHSSAREKSSVRVVRRDGATDTKLRKGTASGIVWAPDGASIYWTSLGQTIRYESYRDLYRYDPEADKRRRLTVGARLADPAPHPEGDWLVAVRTWRGQSQLVRVDLPDDDDEVDEVEAVGPDAEPPAEPGFAPGITQGEAAEDVAYGRERSRATVTRITAAADGSQYAGPTWDPSGTRLAVAVWKPGGFRDIHVFDRHGHLTRTLLWDRPLDSDPAWTPDGQHLLFISDRDGISNVYAYRWSDGAFFRVSRLLTGARYPDVSPDGRWLVVQAYTASGWRLEELRLDPKLWEPIRIPARAQPAPDGGPSAQATDPTDPLEGVPGPVLPGGTGPAAAVARARARAGFDTLDPAPEPITGRVPPGPRETPDLPAELGRVRRYNPLRTLLPPRYISAFGALTDTGAVGGLSTGGVDALSQHSWSASISYRTDSRYVGWGAGYVLNAFRPRMSVSFSTIALDYGSIYRRTAEPPSPGGTSFGGVWRSQDRYYERRDRLSAGVSIPVKRRHSLSARYKLEFRRPLHDPPLDADVDLLPARGSFSGIVLGWTFGEFRRYAASISPEDSDLLSVSIDLESSYLGAYRVQPDGSRLQLHRMIVTAEGREYITMPWGKNHVLALRLVVGATVGTDVPQRTFRAGGSYGDSPYVSLPDRYYGIRGYATSSMRGNHLYLGSAEYRLPLFYVERGAWTVPIWLRSVALTVFVEAGQAFDTEDYAGYQGSPDGFVAFWGNTRPSVGVELVGDAVLGWGGWFQGRIGYGLGFGAGAIPNGAFYAQLGTSF